MSRNNLSPMNVECYYSEQRDNFRWDMLLRREKKKNIIIAYKCRDKSVMIINYEKFA